MTSSLSITSNRKAHPKAWQPFYSEDEGDLWQWAQHHKKEISPSNTILQKKIRPLSRILAFLTPIRSNQKKSWSL